MYDGIHNINEYSTASIASLHTTDFYIQNDWIILRKNKISVYKELTI